jgi:hypothetical protein
MVRLKVMLAVTGAVVLLYIVLALAQTRDSPPWDQPVLCPKCKSDRVVYILYGEPQMAEDLKRALASRKVELGGCIITPDSKRWECRSCGHRWGAVGHGAGAPP